MTRPAKTLAELARDVGGEVIGDGQIVIHRVASIEEADAGEITFLAHARYRPYLDRCKAAAVIVSPALLPEARSGRSYLVTRDPYVAFAKVLQALAPAGKRPEGISALAHIAASAVLGPEVCVFPNVFVGPRVTVGSRSVLYPGVSLGEGVEVGEDCVIYSNVVIREGCRIGNRVILHPGAVIGSDGFGYAREGAQLLKIPQVGIVTVHDDVEIGANTTIDRATLGRTVIGRGTKIDNLVQIAHNVTIGESCVIAAQTGIAGSTKIGKGVTLAGQVGVVNHVEIGDGAVIGPQSGVPKSVPAGAILSSGIAAAPHQEWLRVMTVLPQLPKLWTRVRALEKKLTELLHRDGKEANRHVRS